MQRRAVGIIVSFALACTSAGIGASTPTDVAVAAPTTSRFVPVTPTRVADTRSGTGFARLDHHTIEVDVARALGTAMSDSVAAALTITLIATEGHASVFPGGTTGTATSVVNARAGAAAVSATTIATLGPDGTVAVHASSPDAHLVIDLAGAFVATDTATSGRFVGLDHVRVLDTRTGPPLPAGQRVTVPLPVAVPSDAVALAVNVTALSESQSGFATLHPAGSPPPEVSQVSVGAGRIAAAASIVPVTPRGWAITTSFDGHLLADVSGYFTGAGAPDDQQGLYVPLPSPVRRLDSRTTGVVHPGGAVEVAIPTPGAAVAGTVTMVEAADWGFVTISPAGVLPPVTSTVNADRPGDTAANLTLTEVSDRGLSAASSAGSHVIVDQTGWFTGPRVASFLPVPENVAPSPEHPTGHCDSSAPGMEPLALPPGQRPSQVVEIGRSVQGRPIWAEYWGPADPRHTLLVIGQIHGDECAPNRLTRAIRERPPAANGIWLIPTMNPDGYAAGTRTNANRVDLNTDGWNVSQPETAAVMHFTGLIRPDVTVHVHSPNGWVGWFGGGPAPALAVAIGRTTGLGVAPAGARPDRSRWFLWQGQQRHHHHPAILIELFAVAHDEVPHARPRPATRPVATVDHHAQLIRDVLDSW